MRRFGLHGTSTEEGRRGPPPLVSAGCAVVLVALGLSMGTAGAQETARVEPQAPQGGLADQERVGTEPRAPEGGTPAPDRGVSDHEIASPAGAATRDRRISLEADDASIRVGHRVVFTGRRSPARRGDPVRLRYRPAGENYRTVAETTTDARGEFRVDASPRHTGAFVVTSRRRSGDRFRSGREQVSVRAKVRIDAERHQLAARGITAEGRVRPGSPRRAVTLERLTGKGWERVDRTHTTSNGEYHFRWEPRGLGTHSLRVRFRGDESNRGDRTALGHRVIAYREDEASYYGPGLYGNTTACGQILERRTVGVAHKRIPCGTVVRFRYRGTVRRIPVIDRGPFIPGRRWDLTDAARRRLGFPKGTDQIWADR